MEEKKESKQQRYVNSIIERMKKDTAMTAALKRADNPATEYRAWEYFSNYNVNIENAKERIPYATISASLARAKITIDGTLSIGTALAFSGKEGNQDDQSKTKLRRLLACDTIEEVCKVLRPILSLLVSRNINISYGILLNEICWFEHDPQKTKAKWAQSFFRTLEEDEK